MPSLIGAYQRIDNLLSQYEKIVRNAIVRLDYEAEVLSDLERGK